MKTHCQRYFREFVLTHDGDECLIWPFYRASNGYAKIWHIDKKKLVHRLVCEHVNGPPPTPKHEAAHSCGKGGDGCVNPHHLAWKTRAENQADRLAHGTSNRGERHGMAKLSESDVREIRAMKGTASLEEIAAMFGIAQSNVSRLQHRKSWGWVE